jgi:hypothetical protein
MTVFYKDEGKGNLPFTVFWLSLDGRPQCKDFENWKEAYRQFDWLRSLGRSASIYRQVNVEETEKQ